MKKTKPKMDKALHKQLTLLLQDKGMNGDSITRVYYFYTKVLAFGKENLQEEKATLFYILSEEKEFHPFLINQLLFETPKLKKQIEENKIEIMPSELSIIQHSLIQCFDDQVFEQLNDKLRLVVSEKLLEKAVENKESILQETNHDEQIISANYQPDLTKPSEKMAQLLIATTSQSEADIHFNKMNAKLDALTTSVADLKTTLADLKTSVTSLDTRVTKMTSTITGLSRNVGCLYEIDVANELKLKFNGYDLSTPYFVMVEKIPKKRKSIVDDFSSKLIDSELDPADLKVLRIQDNISVELNFLLKKGNKVIILEATMSNFYLDEHLLRKLVQLERQIICYRWEADSNKEKIEYVGLVSPSCLTMERVLSLCKTNSVLANLATYIKNKRFLLCKFGNKPTTDWE